MIDIPNGVTPSSIRARRNVNRPRTVDRVELVDRAGSDALDEFEKRL
jgi:hypothetical protein